MQLPVLDEFECHEVWATNQYCRRFHRTLSDAGSILVRELELLVYALIVAGPLLLLGAAAIAAGRLRDRRLFERT